MIQKLIAINTELYLPQIYVKYFNIYNRAKKYTQNAQYVFPMRLRAFLVFKYNFLIILILPHYSRK